ncbi:MAG: hypothetical protein M3340_01095 [Actinomycetota bacterium]|nr:hypothetical protein [Actinomycetota bacterium]
MTSPSRPIAALAAALIALAAVAGAAPAQKRDATTTLFSRALDGGVPNGPSTNPVISADLRYAQVIAFESEASDLVAGDENQMKDVFAVRRAGSFGDTGSEWVPGPAQLVSRGLNGAPANGPSFDPAVDGNTQNRARCVGFLSDASNLVSGDTNGVTDAFVAKAPKFVPKRVSLPDNRQSKSASTDVAVAGDCSRVAFVAGGKLFERVGSSTKRVDVKGSEADPLYDSGDTLALVFGGGGGVYLRAEGASRATRVVKNATNPAYINRRRLGKVRRLVAYETERGGFRQVGVRELGGGERIASAYDGEVGNGDSTDPTIFNSGFNVAFNSEASNLPTRTNGQKSDRNGLVDAYFWSGSPNVPQPVTILESVDSDNDPLLMGGNNVSTSQYRNYVLFESSANDPLAPPQIYMRYLGGI